MDEQKFKELVIYIATQCKRDLAFGMVKLNKLDSLVTRGFRVGSAA